MNVTYLDYNATTPVHPDVLAEMLPYFSVHYGNASNGGHAYGWSAAEAVDMARERLCGLVGGEPSQWVFTAGATESINAGIIGTAEARAKRGKHIVTVATEHKAVLQACRRLKSDGFEVTVLPVDDRGLVAPSEVASALRPDTILTCVMWANNETGVIHPMEEIADILKSHDSLLLTDATQAVGKIPVSVEGIDLLACSAHKFYGPKGVGALYIAPRLRIAPYLVGGSQEDGRRAGTLNVPGIVGMGKAAEMMAEKADDMAALARIRDRFESRLVDRSDHVFVHGAGTARLPQTSSVRFEGIQAATIIEHTRDLAMSTGSACATGSSNPSHVLTAMGLTGPQAASTLRISMGLPTTEEDMIGAADRLLSAITTEVH